MIETLPDVYGGHAFLAAHPAVDPARVGLAGFSFGGVATMLAATRRHNPDDAFRAFLPVYPATWTWNRIPNFEFGDLVDAPHIADDRRARSIRQRSRHVRETRRRTFAHGSCQDRAQGHAGSHHGFDMPEADMEVDDPFGNQGKGGKVVMRYNPDATRDAHRLAVEFFSAALGDKNSKPKAAHP